MSGQSRQPDPGLDPRQGTVADSVCFTGRGLHSGKRVRLRVHPAEPDTGIVFQRVDRAGRDTRIPATWRHAEPRVLSSGLQADNGVRIRTMEHLLAALYACQIDNALIEVDREELPLLDGSSDEFVRGLEAVGVVRQQAPRRCIRILELVRVEDEGRWVSLRPADRFEADLTLTLPEVGRQRWQGGLDPAAFRREIAPARTFGRLKRAIQAFFLGKIPGVQLCRGAGLGNALVVTRSGVLNRGGLRMPDEFVRHRILDAMGDLMLAGAPIVGRFEGLRSSHALNQRLVRELMACPGAWRMETL